MERKSSRNVKPSLKALEMLELEIQRREESKDRRCQSCRSTKRAQRQSVAFREKESQAMAAKRQCAEFRDSEAQAMAAKRQCAEFREKESQAMAAKLQCAEFREKKVQAKATKRQCAEFREKESQAMATKRQCAEFREKESQAMAAKRQCAEFRVSEAQAKATKRQCAEFREKEAQAKKQSWISQACTPSTIIQASEVFIRATKEGPDYICICCNRLMYRKTVIEFKLTKYNKAPTDFTASASCRTKQWICRTYDHALKRGKLPAQAKANNLHIEDVPPELSDLNQLEVRLISLRIPFMKMVALPCGKQCAIHGPAVNVPTDLTSVCTLLPRLPSQIQMIPMKLKRKLCYKGHYMYEYVRPSKVLAALQWLKLNNPLYKEVDINSDWLSDAAQNDRDLWEALSAQHCPPPTPSLTESSSGSLSSNGEASLNSCASERRFAVREVQSLTELSSLHLNDEATLSSLARERGFTVRDVPRDGDCLFSAVAVQLENIGVHVGDRNLREELVEHLQSHPYTRDGSSHLRDCFSPYCW